MPQTATITLERVQVSEYPDGCDKVMLVTEILTPKFTGGPPSRPGVDVIRFEASVPKGEGVKFAKFVLCPLIGVDRFERYTIKTYAKGGKWSTVRIPKARTKRVQTAAKKAAESRAAARS